MSSPNKSCSEDNLERATDTQHYNPLIHQHFRESKIQVVLLPTKGHEVNPEELFQAVVQTNRHLQNRWKTDLVARRVLRRRNSEESAVFQWLNEL